MQLQQDFAGYWDHGFEIGSLGTVGNCGGLVDAAQWTNLDGSGNNIGYWFGRGPQGSLTQPYAEGDTAEAIYIAPNFQGPLSITGGLFLQNQATNGAIYINQTASSPGYQVSGLNIQDNYFILGSGVNGITLLDSGGVSQGHIENNTIFAISGGTGYGIALPATAVQWTVLPNQIYMASSAFNIQNAASAGLYFDGTNLSAQTLGAISGLYFGGSATSATSSEFVSPCTSGKCIFVVSEALAAGTYQFMISQAGVANPYTVNSGFNINSGFGSGTLNLGTRRTIYR